MKSSTIRDFSGLLKIADLDPVSDALIKGDIRYDQLPESVTSFMTLDDVSKRLYNHFAPPIVRSFAGRSFNSGDSKVYTNDEIGDIFAAASVDPTQVGCDQKVEKKTTPAPVSTPRPSGGVPSWVVPSALAATGGSLLLWWYLSRRMKKNRENMTKKAGAYGWALRFEPHANLLDDAMTARSPKQYKYVNNAFRDLVDKDTADMSLNYLKPGAGNTFTWNNAFAFPGDNISAVSGGSEDAPNNFEYAMNAVPAQLSHDGKYGIQYDPRIAPLTMLAASMLPSGTGGYSMDPSIGNMAYVIPAITGQYSQRAGMTDEDRRGAIENGGLDQVVMDSIKSETARYPAVKNLMSAYVNGGFGRSDDPESFGLVKPLWDYNANALTPYGSNALHRVVSDIGAAGGYGGIVPPPTDFRNNPFYDKATWSSEWRDNGGARQNFSKVLPDVGSLPLYSGNDKLRDYINSLDDSGLSRIDRYYKKSGEPSTWGYGESRNEYENWQGKKGQDIQEHWKKLIEKHPYGSPMVFGDLDEIGYRPDLPVDERRRMLYDYWNKHMIDEISREMEGSSYGNDRVRREQIPYSLKRPEGSSLSPEALNMMKKFNSQYVNSAYDSWDRYLDAIAGEKERAANVPYTGYDPAIPEKHYNELLRFFDNVGPSVLMPNTVLGRDAVYHPVGGIVPNATAMYKQYIPYFTEDPTLMKKIDDASGGTVSKAMNDAIQLAQNAEGRKQVVD